MEDMVRYSGVMITPKQAEFLDVFQETGDFNSACSEVGLKPSKVRASLQSGSKFRMAYDKVMESLAESFDYSKVKNLTSLSKTRDKLEGAMMDALSRDDIKEASFVSGALIKCIQEMNKMVDGNLAAQKKIQENHEFKFQGVIDLSGKPSEDKMIDIEYEDLDEQDD